MLSSASGDGQPSQARGKDAGTRKRMNEYKELEKHAEKLGKKAEAAGMGIGGSYDAGDWSGKSGHPQAIAHAVTVHGPGDSYIDNYQQESLPAGSGGKKAKL